MPRRASSGISPGLIIGVVVAAIALVFGAKALTAKKATAFDGSPALPIDEYVEHGNALRGNEYVVEGSVDSMTVTDAGRVVMLKVKASGGENYLGVKIPPELSVQSNIERDQRYSFKVRIEKQGVLVATAVARL